MNVCRIAGVLALTLTIASCAFVYTERADLDSSPHGIRVFPPKFFLAVDTGTNHTTIFYAPDAGHAYDVNPITILAKQDFQLDIEEGLVKSMKSNQDTTGILDFVKSITETLTKAGGAAVSQQTIDGTFGLQSGLYVLQPDGKFARVAVVPDLTNNRDEGGKVALK